MIPLDKQKLKDELSKVDKLQAKIVRAQTIVMRLGNKVLDEWCRTEDCPKCKDCEFYKDFQSLWEALK